jgi:hypothetical protein
MKKPPIRTEPYKGLFRSDIIIILRQFRLVNSRSREHKNTRTLEQPVLVLSCFHALML